MTKRKILVSVASVGICLFLTASRSSGQITAEEHASHHPGASSGNGSPGAPVAEMPANSAPPAGMGPPAGVGPAAGMGNMADMMKGMGKPPPKQLYPSLMALPELTPEKRREVEQQAAQRMTIGISMLGQGVNRLNESVPANDFAAMEEATAQMREAIAQFESGVAARRALVEGRAPREVALAWFKQEMNLSLASAPTAREPFGVTPFHLFTMVLLVGFSLAMLSMYFFKMRRAAALFGRVEAGRGPPPPGSAPDLAGGKPPSDDTPPPGNKPPPSPPSENASVSPAAPPAASEAASTPPVTAYWRGQLRVGSIFTETPSVKTFRLLPSSDDRFLPFTFVPGQFLNLAFSIGGARMNRSYSISSSPNQREYVDLTVRREPRGAISRHIVDLLKVGDRIETGGPVGKFTFTGKESNNIVLISAGVGITPMISITRYLTEQSWPGDIFFVYTCHAPSDFIFANEVAVLQKRNPKLHVAITISKTEGTDWKGDRGRITQEWLVRAVPDLVSRRIHLCGPPSQMQSIKAILADLKVPPEQVKTEAFGTPKPAPSEPGITAQPTAPATGPLVTFSKGRKSAKIRLNLQKGDSPPEQTILELSEELGIGIEFSCRVGTCGVCKVKMTAGEVDQVVQDALDEDDRKNGVILACQAKPRGAVTVAA